MPSMILLLVRRMDKGRHQISAFDQELREAAPGVQAGFDFCYLPAGLCGGRNRS